MQISAPRLKNLLRTCFVIFPLFLLAACQQPVSHVPELTQAEIAAEEQAQQALVDEYARMGGAPRPWRNRKGMTKQFDRVAEKIEAAGAKLCQEMGLPQHNMRCYYYFDRSRSNEINAYADGETIIITRGMLKFVENDDELAFIMAHELAHNLMGHIDAAEGNAMIGLLVGAAIEGAMASQGYSAGGDIARDSAAIGSIAFSPSFEQEADYIGAYIATRAGFNVKRASNIWRRFSLEDPEGVDFSFTHPSNSKRFAMLSKVASEIKAKQKSKSPLLPEVDRARLSPTGTNSTAYK